jgi:hypothetical protein
LTAPHNNLDLDSVKPLGLSASARWAFLTAVVVLACGITLTLKPIPQPAWYHHFADARELLAVPNALNVFSNLPFFLVGLWGVHAVLRDKTQPFPQRWAWTTLFAGLALTGLGSAYYHLAPDNQRLLWDRLPMTIVMAGIVSLLLMNRQPKASLWILPFLTLVGAGTTLGWAWSEHQGHGDLRWYALYEGLVIITSVLLLVLFPARAEGTRALWIALVANIAAKLFELLDKPIYSLGHVVSGHTLKHLAAGLGFVPVVIWLASQNAVAKNLPRWPVPESDRL